MVLDLAGIDIDEIAIGRRLSRALAGKGAFRRFRNTLYQGHPELISASQSFRDSRARSRAVGWLVEWGLVDEDAARQFTVDNREPTLP